MDREAVISRGLSLPYHIQNTKQKIFQIKISTFKKFPNTILEKCLGLLDQYSELLKRKIKRSEITTISK